MSCELCAEAEHEAERCPQCGEAPETVRLDEEEMVATLPVAGVVPRQLGEFRILDELGRGGMGIVFEAIQQTLDRKVALKVLPSPDERSDEQVAMLRREAASIARLEHPRIVNVYTFGTEPGWTYFAMELVAGENLEQLSERESLSIDQVLDIALQITGALECAHDAGVLHRDLKPGNVLVEPSGSVRVADFGLAKWTFEGYAGDEGMILGTPEYMSPEQASGSVLTKATDVYSLGVLLYRLLAGEVPFTAEEPLQVLAMHQLELPRDVRRVAPRVPYQLGEIVMRCLAKRESDRYADMGALRQALDDFRLEYADLHALLERDNHDTEALVLDVLSGGAAKAPGQPAQRLTEGLRYVEGTVLVADLGHFLRLAVTLRPQKVTALLELFYSKLRQTIERHRGTVVELFGDTALATFGDPIPVANHTEVALDAALELRRVLGELSRDLHPPVTVRIGLDSGLLLAGFVNDGRERRYHAYGDAVVIAHALERHAAGRSELLVGGALWQASRDGFDYRPGSDLKVQLRGRTRLVRPKRLIGRSS